MTNKSPINEAIEALHYSWYKEGATNEHTKSGWKKLFDAHYKLSKVAPHIEELIEAVRSESINDYCYCYTLQDLKCGQCGIKEAYQNYRRIEQGN